MKLLDGVNRYANDWLIRVGLTKKADSPVAGKGAVRLDFKGLQDFNAFNQHIHFNISIHQQLGN